MSADESLANVTSEHATVTRAEVDGTRVTAITPDNAAPAPTVLPAPPVVTVQVPYRPPHIRALSTAQRTALASLAASIMLVVSRMILAFLNGGDYSKAAIQAFVIVLAQGVLTTCITFLQKLTESNGSDAFKVADKAANIEPVTAVQVPPVQTQ